MVINRARWVQVSGLSALVLSLGYGVQAQPPETSVQPSQPESIATELLPLNPQQPLLDLPIEPDAVTIDLNQPITLNQALQLARRNNLELRVTELQLEQSQVALKQARAANWPTLTAQFELAREESSLFQLTPQPFPVNAAAQAEVSQRTLITRQTQQALSLQDLAQDINDLQVRLTQGPDQQLQLAFDQQIQLLQQRAATTGNLPGVFSITPLPPITPLVSSGQGFAADTITNTFSGNLALTYNLFTSGGRPSAIRAAKLQVRLAELAVQAQLEQLQLDVTNDYYNLQESGALVIVAQSAVTNAEKSRSDAQALENAGLGTKFDVLQADVRLADTQQNLQQAQTLYAVAQRQLSQRLNIPPNTNLTAAEPVQPAGGWPLSLAETIVLALQHRPDLLQLQIQARIAKAQRKQILAAIRPQVQAFATLDVQDELQDDVLGAFGYSIGVQVNWNFFDGGSTRSQAKQQDVTVELLKTQFADTTDALRLQVEQAYYSLEANRKNIDTSARTVEQAKESLRLARLRFQAGLGTLLDISTAESDLTQAEGNLLSAVLDYNRALATLQRSTSYQQDPSTISE